MLDGGAPSGEFDLIIVADTGARSQLEAIGAWLTKRADRVIVLDHHVQGDLQCSAMIVEPSLASTTQMVLRLLDALAVPLTGGRGGIAEALFLGLSTDTGWFRFDNAGAEALRDAARLIDAGADKSRIYHMVEENDRPERLRLTAFALASLEFLAGGRVAMMRLGPADFEVAGGVVEDLSGIVNLPLSVGQVRVSVLLSARDEKETKISFRSKPVVENAAHDDVYVNALAKRFGGGGHVRAAGARLPLNVVAARERVAALIEEALGQRA
jgi:phosphoesterase RecJ-like protein